MTTQLLSSRVPPLNSDKHAEGTGYQHPPSSRRLQTPMYIPPNEFRMKLLKRILSVDGTIDNKALHKLQKSSTDKTLQANIVFQNGDVGTLISLDRYADSNYEEDTESEPQEPALPALQSLEKERCAAAPGGEKRQRPLKLPPIIMPPIHTLAPRPLIYRDFSGPVDPPGALTNDDWEELEDCRYLRPSKKQFRQAKLTERSFLQ